MLLLIEQGKLLGVCQLKFHEMDIYPEKEHWLGGVYICEHQRGRGLAQKMVIKAKEIATSLGIKTLYLQTTELSGGIYKKLGWQPTAQITSKGEQVLVMQCDLSKSEKVSINDPLI
jgi:GNAT superfamily N-acetyltransferase